MQIEEVSSTDPNKFWNEIKDLGPRKDMSIPTSVRMGNELITDRNNVLSKWKTDFENLYNSQDQFENTQEQRDYVNNIKLQLNNIEESMYGDDFEPNIALNESISLDEVEKVLLKLKNRKSVGIDNIPNEVLKCPQIIMLLYNLFNTCFNLGIVPSLWNQSIIKPIPKGCDKDPYVP